MGGIAITGTGRARDAEGDPDVAARPSEHERLRVVTDLGLADDSALVPKWAGTAPSRLLYDAALCLVEVGPNSGGSG